MIPSDEQIEILKEMQALGMKVSGSAIDNDPRISADPNPLAPSTPLPEQGGFNERLDEILWAVANHYDPDTTDPYPHMTVPEAKAAIRTLVLEEIIGEDSGYGEWQSTATNIQVDGMNNLRAEQRKKLEDTHGKK